MVEGDSDWMEVGEVLSPSSFSVVSLGVLIMVVFFRMASRESRIFIFPHLPGDAPDSIPWDLQLWPNRDTGVRDCSAGAAILCNTSFSVCCIYTLNRNSLYFI